MLLGLSLFAGLASQANAQANQPPVANAGPSRTVVVDTLISLNGSASSDPDGTIVAYRWSAAAESGVIFIGGTTSVTTTTFVGTAGTHRVTLRVTDNDGATNETTLVLTVIDALALPTPDNQHYTRNQPIDVTLPAATGGNSPYTYTLTGAVLTTFGLSFNATTRAITGSGNFGTPYTTGQLTYTATDSDTNTASVSFDVTSYDRPLFPAVENVTYTGGEAISLTLPEPTAGRFGAPPPMYTLTAMGGGALPAGLTFNATTRTLSGMLTTPGTFALTYRIDDLNGADSESTFNIIINAAPPPESSDATLSGLVLSDITLTFNNTTTDYTATAVNTIESTTVTATTTNTAATITVNSTPVTSGVASGDINLAVGSNTITILVTAEDTSTQSYTITVTREGSSDTSLSGLSLSVGILSPVFAGNISAYTATVENVTATITVTPTSGNDMATITVGGTSVTSGVASGDIALGVGDTTITIIVTPENNSTPQTYTVTVTRATATVAEPTPEPTPVPPPPTADAKQIAAQIVVNEAVLPETTTAIVNNLVVAITDRVANATSASARTGNFQFGGGNSLHGILVNSGNDVQNDSFDWKKMMGNSSFTMPLNAVDGGGVIGNTTIWGGGNYTNLSGSGSGDLKWDGDLGGITLGIDSKVSPNLLLGLSISQTVGSFDYTDEDGDEGTHESDLTSIHPYVNWQSGNFDVWATVGYGTGEVEIEPDEGESVTEDTDLTAFAIGINNTVTPAEDDTTIRFKGEASLGEYGVEGATGTDGNVARVRVAVEGSNDHQNEIGNTLTSSVELGVRYDGGDSINTGFGIELGGGLKYISHNGLRLEGRAHWLAAHSEEIDEWGVSGLVGYGKGIASKSGGLSFSLSTGWGAETGTDIWNQNISALSESESTTHIQTEMSYGMPTSSGNGMITPYIRLRTTTNGTQHHHLGARWSPGTTASLNLEAGQEITSDGETDNSIRITGELAL